MKQTKKAVYELTPANIWEEIICIQGQDDPDWEKLDDKTRALLREWGESLCNWQKQICAGEVMKKGYGSTSRNEGIIINSPLPIIFDR